MCLRRRKDADINLRDSGVMLRCHDGASLKPRSLIWEVMLSRSPAAALGLPLWKAWRYATAALWMCSVRAKRVMFLSCHSKACETLEVGV